MRKFGIFATVAILLVICVMPASALSNGDGNTLLVPLRFDALFNEAGRYDWFLNDTKNGTFQAGSESEDGKFLADVTVADREVSSRFWLRRDTVINEVQSFTLVHSGVQVLDLSWVDDFVLFANNGTLIEDVTISTHKCYGYRSVADDQWVLNKTYKVATFTPTAEGTAAPIGVWLAQLLDPEAASEYQLIEGLMIQVRYRDADSVGDFGTRFEAKQGDTHFIDEWSAEQGMHITEEISVEKTGIAWIVDVVESFLDFQLVPNITFGDVLWFVLVIGLLFLVFKMTT